MEQDQDSLSFKNAATANTSTLVKPSTTDKTFIALVSPTVLAYRLCYLLSQLQKESKESHQDSAFFRTTKKGLEALAENKNIDEAQHASNFEHKAPISEAYIAYTIYELECIGCCLVKVDREYLVGALASLKKLKKLAPDNDKMNTLVALPWNNLKQAVQASLNKKSSDDKSSLIEKKAIEEVDEQQVLLCIWKALLAHVKSFIDISVANNSPSSERIKPLAYKSLCALLPYQLHQNGLASYLYSIAQYCQARQLPRLDYLVVKEGTGLPDGILATEIEAIKNFHDQLEQVVAFVKESDNSFPSEPSDLKFEKKSRAKKPSRKQVTFAPLTGE